MLLAAGVMRRLWNPEVRACIKQLHRQVRETR
jgi:hypothetical protein